jgi:hypothetical protein
MLRDTTVIPFIPGFVTQKEAQRWIEDKAPAWLSGR